MYILLFAKVLLICAFTYSYSKIFDKDLFNQKLFNTVTLLILGCVIICR